MTVDQKVEIMEMMEKLNGWQCWEGGKAVVTSSDGEASPGVA